MEQALGWSLGWLGFGGDAGTEHGKVISHRGGDARKDARRQTPHVNQMGSCSSVLAVVHASVVLIAWRLVTLHQSLGQK